MWQAAGQREAATGSTPGPAQRGRWQGEETDECPVALSRKAPALPAREEGLGGREQREGLPKHKNLSKLTHAVSPPKRPRMALEGPGPTVMPENLWDTLRAYTRPCTQPCCPPRPGLVDPSGCFPQDHLLWKWFPIWGQVAFWGALEGNSCQWLSNPHALQPE